ncbi:MAG: DEAD/DEAH box helicase, partial [Duncaniella sp.]|nr:DEAD/DEAH box helicase [Duncaniella sp.]
MITRDHEGVAVIDVVDSEGKPVIPDPKNFPGDEGALLRTVLQLREERLLSINWGESNPDAISLGAYPYLVYHLIRCNNIVNSKLEPVTYIDERARLVLQLMPTKGGDSIIPRWMILQPAEDDFEPQLKSDFVILNDSFVLAGNKMFPVSPIGSGNDKLDFFISPFAADMVELFLSVVYSNVDNFTLDWENYNVKILSTAVAEQPAVIFEKVDSDLGLHVRVGATLGSLNEEAVRSFELSRFAKVSPETGSVAVSPVERADIESSAREVELMIVSAAPSRRAARELYFEDDYFIIPESLASPFLLKCLPKLLEEFSVLGTDNLKDYKVSPVKPKINFKYSSGIDFLEGDATVSLGNDTITLGKLFEQYRRDRYVTLSDGNRAVIDDKYIKRLERIFGDKKNSGKNVKLTFFDLPEVEDLLATKLDPSFFSRQRAVFEGINKLASQELSLPDLKASLRPYQEAGVKWIDYLYNNHLGGCLADDMGLGKTVQTIAVLSRIYPQENRPTLIVMPRSLLFNWENELSRFAPGVTFHTYYGTGRNLSEALKANVILTTYAIVRNDIERLMDIDFCYIILDESQNIKNLEAQTTRSVFMLKGEHRLALSGTPIENNLSELYSLFRFLNPGMLGDIEDFNRRYAIPIQRDQDQEATVALRRRIFPFMLRRLKKDVLKELPDRVEQTLYVEMSPEQAEYYEQRRRAFKERVDETVAKEGINKAQFVMFQALTELRRIASVPESLTDDRIRSPKLDLLLENLMEATANGHKCVVFFTYIAGLELTGEALEKNGIGYATMTGATTNRREVVNRFNTDPECR